MIKEHGVDGVVLTEATSMHGLSMLYVGRCVSSTLSFLLPGAAD